MIIERKWEDKEKERERRKKSPAAR